MLVVAVCLLATMLLGQLRVDSWAVVAVAVLATVSFLLMPRYLLWAATRQTRKMLREGSNTAVLGPQQVRLDDSSLYVKTQSSEGLIDLAGIERVDETPHHAFIYVSAMNAIVVPKECVQEGDCASFISALRQVCQVAGA